MKIPAFRKYLAVSPVWFFLFVICLSEACQMPSGAKYQKEVPITNAAWNYNFQPFFSINIKDTSARYQTYILLRHDASYPFANIWLRLWVKQPGDSAWSNGERLDLRLADISGSWLGKGMGSVWEHKIPLNKTQNLHFSKPGTYQVKVEQIMRDNPLAGILNAGIIVEKIN
ncbi:MAG TPA: gliding motility lipoprotein GldH [Edaphocola sp.]|nr:gliding motility lipoprotein GldH [Edaphocola sp.]